MTFYEAMNRCVEISKENNRLVYVYYMENGEDSYYYYSSIFSKSWLFKAYPGGRKILSTLGKSYVGQ